MENYKITPAQISASSQLSGQYSPNQGRLHVKFDGGIGSSWIAGANNLHQWFQIDLRITTNVTFVATQGRDGINQWVTKFKLQYSNDSISFNAYKQQGENTDKVRNVNVSHTSPKNFKLMLKKYLPPEYFRDHS